MNNRVLFIFRDFPAGTPQGEDTGYIIDSLRKKYALETYRDLDKGVIELMRSNPSSDKFDAIITHMPYDPSASSSTKHSLGRVTETLELSLAYRKSTAILQEIKKITDIPIVAYTGAGDSPSIYSVFVEEGGVDYIVPKTLNFKDDFRKIQSALENLLRKYKQMPLNIPKPVLRIENGYTVTEARVNLNEGIGFLSATRISNECYSYSGKILFRKSGEAQEKEQCYGKDILELMSMALREGAKITLLVDGEDEKAKKQALRLYSAFSSRYSFAMDFERFGEKCQTHKKEN